MIVKGHVVLFLVLVGVPMIIQSIQSLHSVPSAPTRSIGAVPTEPVETIPFKSIHSIPSQSIPSIESQSIPTVPDQAIPPTPSESIPSVSSTPSSPIQSIPSPLPTESISVRSHFTPTMHTQPPQSVYPHHGRYTYDSTPCTTENPLKVHLVDPPFCTACLTVHGAGRLVLGHPLSPVRFLLNQACSLFPPCSVLWSVISFYFERTPDRLSCRRLLALCPGDWFNVDRDKRSIDGQLSHELYTILVTKTPSNQTDNDDRGTQRVNDNLRDAVRNVTRAFGVNDEKQTEMLTEIILEGNRRLNAAYHFVKQQESDSNN